jgi:hypothetical protein
MKTREEVEQWKYEWLQTGMDSDILQSEFEQYFEELKLFQEL